MVGAIPISSVPANRTTMEPFDEDLVVSMMMMMIMIFLPVCAIFGPSRVVQAIEKVREAGVYQETLFLVRDKNVHLLFP